MKKLAFAYVLKSANGLSWLFGSSSEPEVVPAVIPVSNFMSFGKGRSINKLTMLGIFG